MRKRICLEDRVTIPEDVLFENLGDEAVLLNMESGVYYGLDAVGARMWELMAASGSLRDVLMGMEEEYEVSPDVLQRDVEQLLQELLEQNLIAIETSA